MSCGPCILQCCPECCVLLWLSLWHGWYPRPVHLPQRRDDEHVHVHWRGSGDARRQPPHNAHQPVERTGLPVHVCPAQRRCVCPALPALPACGVCREGTAVHWCCRHKVSRVELYCFYRVLGFSEIWNVFLCSCSRPVTSSWPECRVSCLHCLALPTVIFII